MRKKKKFANSLKKAQNQVSGIIEQEGLDPKSKARQITELYRKASKSRTGPKRKLIVSSKSSTVAPNRTSGRKFKMVDRRLKKDALGMKKAQERNKNKFQKISKKRFQRRK